jgi:putative transposase
MARGNRHHVGGLVWHITERCHRKQFLLKFARDRRAWTWWLFESRRRFGLSVLNYQVTCNHIHLLVRDRGTGEIARSMQLTAGCTGRSYRRRKRRRGAFWEDAYHATAVDTDEHLWRCLIYIDLNMVRAGVVTHPREWREAGYHEIPHPRERYRIIDREALSELLGVPEKGLAAAHREWIESTLREGNLKRERQWSQAVAVGRRSFVERVQKELGWRAQYRRVVDVDGGSVLRDGDESYVGHFGAEMVTLGPKSGLDFTQS